ncbi:MAG: UvrD-helicase domain-containing protein [Kangiellaceae bacterium]|nr:UvrD-helicase domain-containing protein [Kangiellaceae bacterium]
MINDQGARQQAINHKESFIVQAPAGSGKTELLTQRVLKLLSVVENPEEVVAITFTRKAAREMQNRIIEALNGVYSEQPAEPHKLKTWQLANAVIERDHHFGWGLLLSPQRLQIKTFDSLCASIANQMPVLAHFGGQLSPTETPQKLYNRAAQTVVDGLKTNEYWAEHLHRVLAHTDNKLQYLQDLLAQQLAKRDQWLRLHAEGVNERQSLEQGFEDLFVTNVQQLDNLLSSEQKNQLLSCVLFAADYFEEGHEFYSLKKLTKWPEASIKQFEIWKLLANFCLTKSGGVRATAPLPTLKSAETKPEENSIRQMRELSKALFAEFKVNDLLAEQWLAVCNFPELKLQDAQWEVIESLTALMQVATAFLKVEFKNQGEVDYSEISMAASRALGEIGEPSELALKLDYTISHILVDEFQDTSFSQFQLIELLTAGWQPDDGRTLFVVGDPMQSIYRFREANVGLFIQARDHGIGDIALKFLQLTSNFRSSKTVVDWVNHSFEKIFPNYDDPVLGSVKLAYADATKKSKVDDDVCFNVFFDQDVSAAEAEADYIAKTIKQCLQQEPNQTIAILVRARNHGEQLIQALKQASIAYTAEEFEELGAKQAVQDLLTLLRILLHPLDKIAWLALLKSPWFGLTLSDITLLEQQFSDDFCGFLEGFEQGKIQLIGLTKSAIQRLSLQAPVINKHRQQLYQKTLAIQLEALWMQLGGALACEKEEIEEVYAALDFISSAEQQSLISDYQQLSDSLKKLFAPAIKDSKSKVSIMTMHKSKGLEFDTVFLPRLDKKGGNNDKSLMVWEEFPTVDNSSQYLLAPVDQAGELESLYKLVSRFSRDKDRLENARLLYVAATRAKKRLYLTACANANWSVKTEEWKLTKFDGNSLMSLLYPIYQTAIDAEFMRFEQGVSSLPDSTVEMYSQDWPRLKDNWHYQPIENWIDGLEFVSQKTEVQSVEFDWASDVAKTIGVLMHRQLELVANGQAQLTEESIGQFSDKSYQQLIANGFSIHNATYAKQRLKQGLKNVLTDPKAQWILQPHQDARCELALTGQLDGNFKTFVIDRTFVDSDGKRWIIDYKAGSHLGDDIETFVASEVERYSPQLANYKALMESIDSRPIKTALYFPMLSKFVEVN